MTAFAISAERGTRRKEPQRWDGISDVSEVVARWLAEWSGPPLLLNVNVPNRSLADVAGVSVVEPAPWGHLDRAGFEARPAPEGGWLISTRTGPPRVYPDDLDTDVGAVANGRIALSIIRSIGAPPPPRPDALDGLVRALTPNGAAPSII
jgi:broad specificity polyphosphatase/5'/3'-nucleotidase SurE